MRAGVPTVDTAVRGRETGCRGVRTCLRMTRSARDPPDSRYPACRADHLRRQRPGHDLPTDRAYLAAGRSAQCLASPSRRCRLRRFERLRRTRSHTPTAERLAAGGLKYNRFHTTALCSPTRAALLTGRNHHSVGMAGITEMATSAPGYFLDRPNTGPRWRDIAAQWLYHGPIREVP